MTECERLISEGKLDRAFLEPEIRCGYEVSGKMKKVWAIILDLIQQVDAVCRKYDLHYYAIGGTAIGAVRHQGFIPWDDDLDIAMPRADYNKLIEVAGKEFEYPYFLQTPETDPYFYNRLFIRLRNSNTTGISPCDGCLKCNNGIYLDIMPLDGYTDNRECNRFIDTEFIKSKVAWNKYHFEYIDSDKTVRRLMKAFSWCFLKDNSVPAFYREHERKALLLSEKNADSEWLTTHYAMLHKEKLKGFIWKRSGFENVIWMPFEYVRIPMAEGYDDMLRRQFGEYMNLPPRESWGKWHNMEFDPDTGYREYCSEKYKTCY